MLWLSLSLLAGAAHPDSLSHTRIVVAGARATVELRCEALSLIEFRPELDRSRDGLLDEGELAAGRAAIEAYLVAGLRLAQVEGTREEHLTGRLVALVPQDPAELGAFELQKIEARLEYEAAAPLGSLAVETHLFLESNPWHRDFCTLVWNDDAPVAHAFSGGARSWRFDPAHVRRPGVFAAFTRLGLEHILGTPAEPLAGRDHLAFLLALLVAARGLATLVGVVTAFTAAHSVTLAAAALGWVDVPSRFVELAIALSIAYVACDNLLRREARNPWLEAFLFGLLHGLGFAGFLADALAGEGLVVTALLGFNLGVELGQLAFVLACTLLVALLFRAHRRAVRAGRTAGLVPPRVRTLVSAAVALAGFYWFLERAGWLPA
ncbi:MAG TPA: HupE/UreJ family protein [Planctomycetota bacterium]